MLLIPGVLAAFVAHVIKETIGETPIMSGILKNRDFAKGGTIAFATGDASFLNDDQRRYSPVSGPEAVMPRPRGGPVIKIETIETRPDAIVQRVTMDMPGVTTIEQARRLAAFHHTCRYCGGSHGRHAIGCPNEGYR